MQYMIFMIKKGSFFFLIFLDEKISDQLKPTPSQGPSTTLWAHPDFLTQEFCEMFHLIGRPQFYQSLYRSSTGFCRSNRLQFHLDGPLPYRLMSLVLRKQIILHYKFEKVLKLNNWILFPCNLFNWVFWYPKAQGQCYTWGLKSILCPE